MADEKLQGEEIGPCPFCGLGLAASLNPIDGRPDGLIHALPICATFDSMDPEKFISAAREKLESMKRS